MTLIERYWRSHAGVEARACPYTLIGLSSFRPQESLRTSPYAGLLRGCYFGIGWWSVSPAQELHLMVVLVPEAHDTEHLRGLRVLYHDHVALGVVGLDRNAYVVAWLVFIWTFSVASTVAFFRPFPLPLSSRVSSRSRPLGPRFPERRMRRKIALT